MAGRFYYRPVDPGYERFGASIARAVGSVGESFDRAGARKKEEERYREGISRQDEAIRRAEEARLNAIRRALGEQGRVPEEEAFEEGLPAPGAVNPPTTTLAPGPDDPVPTPSRQLRPGIATVMDPELGEVYIDPDKSLESIREEAAFAKAESRRLKEHERKLGLIRKAMEAGSPGGEEITPEEMGEIRALEGDTEPMETFARDKRQHGYRMEQIEAARQDRGAGGAGGLTGNRALELAHQEVRGLARRMKAQGLSDDQILGRLANYADAVGGSGVLYGVVESALTGEGLSASALTNARGAMQQQYNYLPGTPEYHEEFMRLAREIQKDMTESQPDFFPADEAVASMESVLEAYPDLDEDTAVRVTQFMMGGDSLERAHQKATRRERR